MRTCTGIAEVLGSESGTRQKRHHTAPEDLVELIRT